MRTLIVKSGIYRIYVKSISRECNEAVFYRMRPAMLAANALAHTAQVPVYLTEEVDGPVGLDGKCEKRSRIYEIPAGGGMPQLMEEPAPIPSNGSGIRKVELEVD